MAIDTPATVPHFASLRSAAPAARKGNTDDRPKADIWLNIGYSVDVQSDEGETVSEFVGLPLGVPLDTQDAMPVPQNGSADFRNKRAATNDLLEAMKEAAAQLQPGETRIVNLQVQMRRVKSADVIAIVEDKPNPYALKLTI